LNKTKWSSTNDCLKNKAIKQNITIYYLLESFRHNQSIKLVFIVSGFALESNLVWSSVERTVAGHKCDCTTKQKRENQETPEAYTIIKKKKSILRMGRKLQLTGQQ
jgi:hypothetical protein